MSQSQYLYDLKTAVILQSQGSFAHILWLFVNMLIDFWIPPNSTYKIAFCTTSIIFIFSLISILCIQIFSVLYCPKTFLLLWKYKNPRTAVHPQRHTGETPSSIGSCIHYETQCTAWTASRKMSCFGTVPILQRSLIYKNESQKRWIWPWKTPPRHWDKTQTVMLL